MLKTNEDKLVMMAVQGGVSPPGTRLPWFVEPDGEPFMLPAIGGITYNVMVGDPCFGWVGDHIEPGVSSILNANKRVDAPNSGYNTYACVGNVARVISGAAKGELGTVLGQHGGAEHVILDFAPDVLEQLTNDDKFLIKAFGLGLRLTDYPDISCFNLDPGLLHKMNIVENGDETLSVGVTHCIPGCLMGSGIGSLNACKGDYDIQTADREYVTELGLQTMRFGDIVGLLDCDNRFGRSFRRGAVTIGVVVHSDSMIAGHGPGVVALLSSSKPLMKVEIDPDANVAKLLKIGRFLE